MAYAVRMEKSSIQVHQILHGYEDGHRLIASSVQLKSQDKKLLLAMTDVSGPSAHIPESGYLTGYPLPDSDFYALGRTWSAPEMSRPGCVWTHTLLIDFSDLAILDSMRHLLALFSRPSFPIEKASYEETLEIHPRRAPAGKVNLSSEQRQYLSVMLSALYENAGDKVVILACEDWDREFWILKIWDQQWPRLRRNFRFCTLSYADRSTPDNKFDVQVLPESGPGRQKVKISGVLIDLTFPTISRTSPWLELAVEDLLSERGGSLRDFLRQVGGDIGNGRCAFAVLCELHTLLFMNQGDTSQLKIAVKILVDKLGEQEGRIAKKIVVEKILDNIGKMDDPPISFVLDNLELIERKKWDSCASRLGQIIWKENRALFWMLLAEEGTRAGVAERAAETLAVNDLIDGLDEEGLYIQRISEVRPDILYETSLWKASEGIITKALQIVASNSAIAGPSVAAMIRSGRRGMALRVNQSVDHRLILLALTEHLDKEGGEMSEVDKEWVLACVRDLDNLASHLVSGAVRKRTTLLAFARSTDPDDIPNAVGDDPWLAAVRSATGQVREPGQIYLSAYLLARALGKRSRNAGELIEIAFDDVYKAASRSRLPEDAWRLLEPKLPWSFFWFNWDRCQRLRSAVTDVFVNRALSHEAYIQITDDDRLFEELTTIIASTFSGRNYLSAVKRTLSGDEADVTTRRIGMVTKILSHHIHNFGR